MCACVVCAREGVKKTHKPIFVENNEEASFVTLQATVPISPTACLWDAFNNSPKSKMVEYEIFLMFFVKI